MKRSEMINKLLLEMKLHEKALPDNASDIQCADLMLTIIEQCGMLPPVQEGRPSAKVHNRCKWDAEDSNEHECDNLDCKYGKNENS